MAEPMEISTSDSSRKRSLPDEDTASIAKSDLPTPPLTASPAHQDTNRQQSPAPSSSSLSSARTGANDQPTDPSAPPKKRRKLTAAEKEEQRLAKEQKDKERAEAKLKKDEEKRLKNEEKEAKQRERDMKKAKEDEEKLKKQREKDEKKAKEEEDRLKKLRAQPKIATFFKMPSSKQPTTPAKSQSGPAELVKQTSESLTSAVASPSPTQTQKSPQQSDYQRTFLPFQLKSHTTCAPAVLPRSNEEAEAGQRMMDQVLGHAAKASDAPTPSLHSFFAEEKIRSRGLWQPTAREVIESLHGSSQTPIDLTDESGELYRPSDLLGSLTVRHLHFSEDVRPPYFGTYSRKVPTKTATKLRKNPFNKLRQDTDYDYDSEAEWEEPEEGEDILSDGEDDEESVGSAEEMEGFLEEDAPDQKRHIITGDLKPISTGICWEDEKVASTTSKSESGVDLEGMKIAFFIPLSTPSINPFSAVYWQTSPVATAEASSLKPGSMQLGLDGKMKPPASRLPLQPRSSQNETMTIVGAVSGTKGPIMGVSTIKAAKVVAKPLDGAELAEFKEAVQGSNLTKVELLKALKKRFPKHTNDVIKATLSSCFARVGQHEADKVWKAIGS